MFNWETVKQIIWACIFISKHLGPFSLSFGRPYSPQDAVWGRLSCAGKRIFGQCVLYILFMDHKIAILYYVYYCFDMVYINSICTDTSITIYRPCLKMSVVLEPGIGGGVSSQDTASPIGLILMMKNAR